MDPKSNIWIVRAIPKPHLREEVAIIGICQTKPSPKDMDGMLEGWYFESLRNGGDSKEEARESCKDVHEDWLALWIESWLYE